MNAVVVYSSKTGFTKKYADWIASQLSVVSYDVSEVNKRFLKKYDTIIFGGGVYVGKISDAKFLEKNIPKLPHQHWLVFAVGLTPPDDLANQEKLMAENFSTEVLKRIDFFYFQGGIMTNKLPRTQKLTVNLLRKMVSFKKEPSEDEKWILEALSKDSDYSDMESVNVLLEKLDSV